MGRAVAVREAVIAALRAAGCVYAEDEAALLLAAARDTDGDLDAMVRRRVAGEPLELVVGWAELCGARVATAPGVFVPRRRSELLVDVALARAPSRPVVVDLCCGTGALALVVALRLPAAEVHAADVSADAVRCAARNLAGVGGQVHEGDLYDALPRRLLRRVDLLVVNAPYVPTGELHLMPAEAREHEPRQALDGGADGVDLHRRVADDAPRWLSERGLVLIETSEHQAPLTAAALTTAGLQVEVLRDEARDATVAVGSRQPASTSAATASGSSVGAATIVEAPAASSSPTSA